MTTNAAIAALLIAMLPPGVPAGAASPFDGDWVSDLDRQSGLPTDTYLIRDGLYSCASCEPPRAYPADGRAHPVSGDHDVTSEAVTIAGPRTIVTHIVGPPLDRMTTMTVSPDGGTATYVSIDHRPGIAAALRTEYRARRVAPAPAGAHPVSGTWQGVRYVAVPELARTTTLRLRGDRFGLSTPFGTSFTAVLGGSDAPVRSTHGGNVRVAVRRSGDRRIEERATRDGQLVLIRTFTVAPDGCSLEIATTDPARGTTFRATSRRAGAR